MNDIGLREINVNLRGISRKPDATGDAFFRAIGLPIDLELTLIPSERPFQTARVELFSVSASDVEVAGRMFEASIEEGFAQAAAILERCSSPGFDSWRGSDREADIFIGGWLANEQFDLRLPVAFVAACARLRLPIQICTND